MKTVIFGEGVVFALLASSIGSIAFVALSTLFSEDLVLRLLISGLSLAYVFYLLVRSQEPAGRITVMLGWCIVLLAVWLIWPSITLFLLIHIIALWLIRCLYFYASLFSSLVDLGLNAFSLAAATWACHHTGSLFLTLWCFFLVQALFVAIPTGKANLLADKTTTSNNPVDFNRAYQVAEAAVRKLSTYP